MTTMTWTPQTHDDYDALKGFDVYTSDDEKIGTIKEVFHPQEDIESARGKHYFRVEPGAIGGLFSDIDEVYIPERIVQSVNQDDDRVILEVPKDKITQEEYSRPFEIDSFRRS
jgi:sporulation protein YlmC with PRC-barrel domain